MAKIKTTFAGTDRVVEVDYDFGETLEEMVKKFGEEAVHSNARASFTVSLQGIVRNAMKVKEGETEKTDEEIQALVNEWTPGTRKPGKSKLEKAQDLVGGLSAEEKEALLKQLRAKPKAA